ncbi:MAG: UPF0175 family protein, partial [Methylobacter sp.]|nr:UPF0175 family protein [Methylobacter sp.]
TGFYANYTTLTLVLADFVCRQYITDCFKSFYKTDRLLEPVLILKGNQPNALLLNLKSSLGELGEQIKPALAASLFKDRVLSLGAAQISGLSLSEFIDHLTQLD